VLAEQLVRKADAENLTDYLTQLIERRQDLDFPWYPARVVCHDILGQTALVDLAGLRDAIAEKGGDPSKVNPVVPTQLIVDHSLAVELVALILTRLRKTVRLKIVVTKTVSTLLSGRKLHLKMST
jgi:aconitase A